jgi:archaemetzincin
MARKSREMDRDGFCLGIQPIGEIDPGYLKILAGSFLGELGIRTLILPGLAQPDYAFDSRRIQYDAGIIITRLEAMEFKGCRCVIALMDADLFIPVFSFVLGEARMGGDRALVSIFRLQGNRSGIVKVALHEFGHLMGLDHCHEDTCVMKFSKNIEQLDSISSMFCDYCLDQIRYAIRKKQERP